MERGVGIHLVADFYGCEGKILDDCQYIKTVIEEAARQAKATIVGSFSHSFNPQGVTGIVVIAESHLSIHTWPEHNYAAVDIFTCGKTVNPYIAFQYLKDKLHAQEVEIKQIARGTLLEETSACRIIDKPT